MKKLIRRVKTWFIKNAEQPKLPIALGLALSVAIAMTVTGVAIYYIAGFYKLDLSRPGYENERAQVTNDTNDIRGNYDTTSPVTPSAIENFLRDYDAGAQKAAAAGDFRDQSLDDQNLGLGL